MAQNDKEHIGDSQNSQWWGAKQGLFINALANQYGSFETDATYRATINQNTAWSFEVVSNGRFAFSNSFNGTINRDTGFQIYNLNNISYINFIKSILLSYGKQTTYGIFNGITTNRMYAFNENYDGTIFYSQNPPTFDAFAAYKQRIKDFNTFEGNFGFGISPLWILSTDDLYPAGCTTMRMNYLADSASLINYFNTGVVRDFRIFTRVLQSAEVTNNYHAMAATDTTNLFIEYKMSQLSDFYTFGGLLYARNTGSSGNGLDNGTGYDLNLIGYVGNIPILQSIY